MILKKEKAAQRNAFNVGVAFGVADRCAPSRRGQNKGVLFFFLKTVEAFNALYINGFL